MVPITSGLYNEAVMRRKQPGSNCTYSCSIN